MRVRVRVTVRVRRPAHLAREPAREALAQRGERGGGHERKLAWLGSGLGFGFGFGLGLG